MLIWYKSLYLNISNGINMDLAGRKYHLIEQVMLLTESEIDKVEKAVNNASNNLIEQKLSARALEAEEDIKEGKVYTLEEAETRLNKRFGV